MGRRIQQSTFARSQAASASARSELGSTTLTSPSMRLPPVRARGRRLHMSKMSQQLANPTGRQGDTFTRSRDSSSASPTIATTDDQSNVATRSVTSSTKAQQPGANNTPTPVDYSSLIVTNLKSILSYADFVFLKVSSSPFAFLFLRREARDPLLPKGRTNPHRYRHCFCRP